MFKISQINHITYRIITAVWLSLLYYLFISAQKIIFPDINTTLFHFSLVIMPLLGLLIGYLWGYKILLQSTDDLYRLPLKCVAGLLTGSISYLMLIGLKIQSFNIFSLVGIIGFLLGWSFLYKIFLLPKVDYIKMFPTYKDRIISAIYFGLMGYLISKIYFITVSDNTAILPNFILTLSAYIGFYHGYRVILLPNSWKAFLKSIILGFVGSAYILSIFLLIFSMGFIIISIYQSQHFNLLELFSTNYALMFVFLPIIGIFICTAGIVISMIIYLLSRLWAKNSH